MGSIADSIPPEILKEVFGYIEAWLDQQATEKYFLEPHHSITMPLSAPRTAPSYVPTCGATFANFRLVSRKWKSIADTIFFREVAINLGFGHSEFFTSFGPEYNEQPLHKPGSEIMRFVMNAEYTSLIRLLHVRLHLYENDISASKNFHGCDETDMKYLNGVLRQFRQLLLDLNSCSVIRLYLPVLPKFLDSIFVAPIITKMIIDAIREALKQSPKMQFEFYIHSAFLDLPRDDGPRPMESRTPESQEHYLTPTVPDDLLSVSERLELELQAPVTNRLFTSFSSMKKLSLHKTVGYGPIDAEAIENGLLSMPCLEDLTITCISISVFPSRLRSFKLKDDFLHPDTKFWNNLCCLEHLEVLQLTFDFDEWDEDENWRNYEPDVDWSQITDVRFSELHTFRVHTSNIYSPNVTTFCIHVLHKCSLLENLKLAGVRFRERDLLGIVTRSLKTVTLTYHRFSLHTAYFLDYECGTIHWSVVKAIFQKNPRITKFELGVDANHLCPFTFQEIDEISMSSTRLACIQIYRGEDSITAESGPGGLLDDGTDFGWLYIKNPTPDDIQDAIVEKIITTSVHPVEPGFESSIHEFIVDLDKLRMLKEKVAGGDLSDFDVTIL
jgi:hypothetical protein